MDAHTALHHHVTALLEQWSPERLGGLFSRASRTGAGASAARAAVQAWLVLFTLTPDPDECTTTVGHCEHHRFGYPDSDIRGLAGVEHRTDEVRDAVAVLDGLRDGPPDRDGARRLAILPALLALTTDGCYVDGAVSDDQRVGPRVRAMVGHLSGVRPIRGVPAAGLLREMDAATLERLYRAVAVAQVDWARSEAFLDPTDSFAAVTVYRFRPSVDPGIDPAAVAAFIERPVLPVPPLHAARPDDHDALRDLITNLLDH
jgi:hypothetical protein